MEELIKSLFTNPAVRAQSMYGTYFAPYEGQRVGIAVAYRTREDGTDFALNQDRLQRVADGVAEGKLDAGFIVLARRRNAAVPEVVAWRNVEDVTKLVAKLPVRSGTFGTYY